MSQHLHKGVIYIIYNRYVHSTERLKKLIYFNYLHTESLYKKDKTSWTYTIHKWQVKV